MIARRLRAEEGFTVATALLVLLIAMLLTTGAIAAAMSTQSGVRRDGNAKRALQGANAGVEATVQRLSASMSALASSGDTLGCLQQDADLTTFTNVAPDLDLQWCPDGIVDQVGAHETATTYVSTDQDIRMSVDGRNLVTTATATDAEVPRRVMTTWASFDVSHIFGDYTVFGGRNLSLQGNLDIGTGVDQDIVVRGNVGSNGNIDLGSNSQAQVWGDATPGPDGSITGAADVHGNSDRMGEEYPLPSVTIPDDVRTTNNNADLCSVATCTTPVGGGLPKVTLSGSDQEITGSTFALCALDISGTGNATFTFTSATPIRIFIDAPASCGNTSASFTLGNKPLIVVHAPALQVLVVGDQTDSSKSLVDFSNQYTSGPPISVYAPDSNVTVGNNGMLNGGIVGGNVTVNNGTQIVMPTSPVPPPLGLGITPGIERGPYTECTPDQTSPTTTGC